MVLAMLGVLAAPVPGLTDTGPEAAANDDAPSVEEILTREPDADDYESQQRCVQTSRIRRTEVLDDQHIVLHVGRDEYYVIQFNNRCPGLRRDDPVIFESSLSSRLCKMDAIRGTYSTTPGSILPGPRCSVPGFDKVSKEQVVMLKDSLKLKRDQEREERKAARQAAKEAKQQEREDRRAAKAAAQQAEANEGS
jgi:hypothetical protein